MKSFTELSKIIFNGVLLSVFIICFTNSVFSQSAFNRNDNYDFRGKHHFSLYGSTIDNLNIHIESNSDFRKFKFYAKSRYWIWLGDAYFVTRMRVDMNSDGIWEQEWTTSDEINVSYNYPNPPNGISANHTITVEIHFVNLNGDPYYRIRSHQITIFSTPRVYVDSDNNSFIQLRNEDATPKIPVLMVEGFDPLNEKFAEDYYNLTWELVNTDLYPIGYEVFILNFSDGGTDLRDNAVVLLKALEKIHEICPSYKIALAGLSMGGPIGRYALANKESQGGTHNVGLFLSYDSPQYGAHLNPGLQDWIYEQDPGNESIRMYWFSGKWNSGLIKQGRSADISNLDSF
jgi:hypothetical protein